MFEPTPQALVAQRYSLIREIGRGGMGSVWEAFDQELEAPCALKFILDQESKPPEVRARFLREARAVARLQSPHAVSIRGVGECDGALYIAMELLVGETLFARLGRCNRLSAIESARIVEQMGSVLATAHRAGIVHRDLKPENIWLWSEADTFVKLLDFGVAKLASDSNTLLKTATGVVVGTPYYMSPEQAAGDRQIDHRSDLWSLAIIAVECLSGKRAFQSTGIGQLLANIINGPTPPLETLYPEASPALAAWWLKATAKDPRQRHETAAELVREFVAGLLGPSYRETRNYGSPPPLLNVLSAPLVTSKPDLRAGMLTVTTPGDGHRTPWNGVVGSTNESVSPFSTTKAFSTLDLGQISERRLLTPRRTIVALVGATAAGAFLLAANLHKLDTVTAPTDSLESTTPSQAAAPALPSASAATAVATVAIPDVTAIAAPTSASTVVPSLAPSEATRVDAALSTVKSPAEVAARPASAPRPSARSRPSTTSSIPAPAPAVSPKDRVGF